MLPELSSPAGVGMGVVVATARAFVLLGLTVLAATRVVPRLMRADSPDPVRDLYSLGIDEVTSPEFEAAIEMTREALIRFDTPADEVQRVTTTMRRERYGSS